MTISKVNGPGWGANSLLTSTQANAFDTKIITALDKTAAGDTLSGVVTVASGGGIAMAAGSSLTAPSTATTSITLAGSSFISSTVNGGVTSTAAGGVTSTVASGITTGVTGGIQSTAAAGGIALNGGANDWPTFPARTLSVDFGCDLVVGVSATLSTGAATPNTAIGTSLLGGGSSTGFIPVATAYGMIDGGMRPTIVNTGAQGYTFYMPLRGLKNGSTLSTATLYVTPAAHGALPGTQLGFGIFYTAKDGSSGFTALKSGTNYAQAAAANVAAYNALTSVSFTANQNNVIDNANNVYFAYLWDECNTNAIAGNRYYSIQVGLTNILDMRL